MKRVNHWFSFSGFFLLVGAFILGWTAHILKDFSPVWALVGFVISIGLCILSLLRIFSLWLTGKKGRLAQAVRWMHAAAFETLAIVAILVLHPMKYWYGRQVGRGARNGRPILLVHGYLHDSSAWIYQKKKLVKAGFGPIYSVNLAHPFRSIQVYAEILRNWAEYIEKETGRSDLILIGHSMGGLVSSWYATRLAVKGTVTDVITIGSPLSGTLIAKFAVGPNAREMERGSQFIAGLQQEILEHRDTNFYHIATETDQIVVPYTSAFLEGPPKQRLLLQDVGHASLLFSPRVAKKIIEWLQVSSDGLS